MIRIGRFWTSGVIAAALLALLAVVDAKGGEPFHVGLAWAAFGAALIWVLRKLRPRKTPQNINPDLLFAWALGAFAFLQWTVGPVGAEFASPVGGVWLGISVMNKLKPPAQTPAQEGLS